MDDDRLKSTFNTAIDAAISEGAVYADSRLTHTEFLSILAARELSDYIPKRNESIGFGVRAFYKGYWGFASSPISSREEAARLGVVAARNAKANFIESPRDSGLVPMLAIESGSWKMPIQEDPFEMAPEEISDYLRGLVLFMGRLKYVSPGGRIAGGAFTRQHKHFASSEGQFTSQKLYNTSGSLGFTVIHPNTRREVTGTIESLTAAGLGFEHFRNQPLHDMILEEHNECMRDLELEVKPIDVGRYTTMMHSNSISSLLHQTIGVATELDRALGYEANVAGTSYISDIESMVGSLKIGNRLLNVECNRDQPGSVGRVKWDDEGVVPQKFSLVKNGVLQNLQTNREGAHWRKELLPEIGGDSSSLGCSYTPDGIDSPMIHCADLVMGPNSEGPASLDEMRIGMGNGIEVKRSAVVMDFQQSTGYMQASTAYQVKDGKRVAMFANSAVLFRTLEIWNNIIDLGSAPLLTRFGVLSVKGEPQQYGYGSVQALPAYFKEMTFIDSIRKA